MSSLFPVASAPVAAANVTLPSGLLASVGSFILSGSAVGLKVGYRIAVAAGAFTFTGKDVDLIISVSQLSLNRVFLSASGHNAIQGFKMIQNFQMFAGDSKSLVVTVKDGEGNPVSITGATIKWRAARSLSKASVISKSTSSGIAITDGSNGVFTVTLDPADTLSLVGTYYHEAEVTGADSAKSTVLSGTMKINPQLIST